MRLIAAVLAVRDQRLLLLQLARGPFAGYWLLPSATVETGTVEEAVRRLLPARSGYVVAAQQLAGVLEEPRPGLLVLRFIFTVEPGAHADRPGDTDIAQGRWCTRAEARELLEERDIVPHLGVMTLVRGWVDETPLPPHTVLHEHDALCPCGSGYSFRGCCGWDV